jgi:hypothetical protein
MKKNLKDLMKLRELDRKIAPFHSRGRYNSA